MADLLKVRRLTATLVALIFLGGCHEKSREPSRTPAQTRPAAMTQPMPIKVGETGADFAARYPTQVRIQHQPAGIDFYSIDWDAKTRGVVGVENGSHPLRIGDVLGLQASQDLGELKAEGLSELSIYAGVSEPERIGHDEARLKVHAILRAILDAGWVQVIERSEPRLRGKDRQDYMFATSSLNGLDATYLPTLEDWMRIESRTPWSFYANGLYLEVMFTREPSLTDPAKLGAYMLTFKFKTDTAYFRDFAGPDHRHHWHEAVPLVLPKLAGMREKKEGELRAKGIAIDETYRDPPVVVKQN